MVPLFAPARQNESLLPEIQTQMLQVLKSGEYVLGPQVDAFEKTLAEKLDYRHAVGVASGAEALVLGLKACGLEAGDEVITPAFSFVASANTVAWAGMKPVFADVDPETFNLSVETVERAITPRTRAIVAVDLYGRQAPIAELRRFCDRQGLFLIEDGAQSIGVPNLGAHVYTLSFYPTKNIGAIGDGGAVLTHDAETATRVRELSRHGGLVRDHYLRVGTTGRLDALQAAVLNVKIPKLQQWTTARRTVAGWYLNHLARFHEAGKIILPSAPAEANTHVWALFTVRFPQGRSVVMEALKNAKVGAAIYYPKAITQQPAMQSFHPKPCPHSERLADEVLSLPIFPELTGKEFDYVVDTLAKCLRVL